MSADRATPAHRIPPRPTLTERRKAETELEIARHAATLFATHGVEATTADQIARAAGVAPRTFYRYFRAKEEAVAPLLAAGGRRWIELLAAQPADLSLGQALERAAVAALTDGDGNQPNEGLEWTRKLLRTAPTTPAVRAVWYSVNCECEQQLIPVLTARLGSADPLEVRLAAAAATAAIRVALEAWAAETTSAHGPAELAARSMRELTSGLMPICH